MQFKSFKTINFNKFRNNNFNQSTLEQINEEYKK